MKIDGSCYCGDITYEAEIDPENVVICHCSDCQNLSGSAFRTVALSREGTSTLLSGEPNYYVKTAESGNRREQAFCPQCGSPIFSTSVGEGPKIHGIRVGTIRQRDEHVPQRQVWSRSKQHWLADLDTMPKTDKQSQLSLKPAAAD